MIQGIYGIINLKNGKFYVGSSTDIKKRWKQHIDNLRRDNHCNPHLQAAWHKYGRGAFSLYILERVESEGDLISREQHHIDRAFEAGNTYNLAHYANKPPSRKGKTLSVEVCQRISVAQKGRVPWNVGRKVGPHSEETRRKISKALKGKQNALGRHCTEETRHKISEANKGKASWMKGQHHSKEVRQKISEALKGKQNALGCHRSEETRRKLSEALKGRVLSEEHKRRVGKANAKSYPAFIHQKTAEVIPAGRNLKKLCLQRGLHYSSMCAVKNGGQGSHKGWVLWEA